MTRATLWSMLILGALFEADRLAATEPQWPQFRGPGSRGIAAQGHYPSRLRATENLLWKTALPAGQSSPCIWNDRIFLTGLTAGTLETLCLDRRSGKILWRQTAPVEQLEAFESPGGAAAATPVTDGRRVYVYFGSCGLLCYDFSGKRLWTHPLPQPITGWGAAASPILAGGLLVLKCDQDVGSYVLAVDPRTGHQVWKIERPRFRRSYGTPIVWRHGENSELPDELVIPGALELAAYALHNGRERWLLRGLPADMCTTPVTGDGLLYVAAWGPGGDAPSRLQLPPFAAALAQYDKDKSGGLTEDEVPQGPVQRDFGEVDADKNGQVDATEWQHATDWFARTENALLAIRPGGRGDVTATHVAWKQTRGLPYVPSPLYYQGRIYLIKNGGIMSCFDAQRGTRLFQGRLGGVGRYHASPVAGDGKIYVASRRGMIVVIAAGDHLQVLAKNDLGEELSATPALVANTIYIRSAKHLYAFGAE
jgi:outer membrane protein assembly factor BamB